MVPPGLYMQTNSQVNSLGNSNELASTSEHFSGYWEDGSKASSHYPVQVSGFEQLVTHMSRAEMFTSVLNLAQFPRNHGNEKSRSAAWYTMVHS